MVKDVLKIPKIAFTSKQKKRDAANSVELNIDKGTELRHLPAAATKVVKVLSAKPGIRVGRPFGRLLFKSFN